MRVVYSTAGVGLTHIMKRLLHLGERVLESVPRTGVAATTNDNKLFFSPRPPIDTQDRSNTGPNLGSFPRQHLPSTPIQPTYV